tara:strand:+ start:853 stop:1035 length:183 start_codon:yes stop_codon:yes gene_type:complete
MDKTIDRFPRENRSGGELSRGNQYSDLGADEQFTDDKATMDAHQPHISGKFLTGANVMST